MKPNTPLPCDSIRSIALPTSNDSRGSESVCSDVTHSIHHHDRNGSGGESVLDLIRGFAVAHDCIACGPGCGGCDRFNYLLRARSPATLTGYPLSAAVGFGGSCKPPSFCIAALLRESARHDLTITQKLTLPGTVPATLSVRMNPEKSIPQPQETHSLSRRPGINQPGCQVGGFREQTQWA